MKSLNSSQSNSANPSTTQHKTSEIIDRFTGKEYLNATGNLKFGLTNDVMFRIVFQENKYALKGLLCSILHLDENAIVNIEIKNPISLGTTFLEKECRMDILLSLNDSTTVDVEMQIDNEGNWCQRSLVYLCREYETLFRGEDYSEIRPAYHIGLLDFTLFDNHQEFYSLYQLRNAKDNHLYTGSFNLIVISLNQTELASEEDIRSNLVQWVRLFKAKTWEELKMIATDNKYISSAAETMRISEEDPYVALVARNNEEYRRMQARKDIKLEEQAAEIERLRSLLAANGIKAD